MRPVGPVRVTKLGHWTEKNLQRSAQKLASIIYNDNSQDLNRASSAPVVHKRLRGDAKGKHTCPPRTAPERRSVGRHVRNDQQGKVKRHGQKNLAMPFAKAV